MAKGAKHVVLKGIQREGESCIRNFVGGKDCETFEAHNEYLPTCCTARATCTRHA